MSKSIPAAAVGHDGGQQRLRATAALGALGVVYGDIGTSLLYALKEAAKAAGAGSTPTPEAILGVLSLMLWSLILIISLKYAIFILRAGNRGEGGIVALLALLHARDAPPYSWRAYLLILGLVGAALLYGDGAITPAISVLSAIEGLGVDAPWLEPSVVYPSPSRSCSPCSLSNGKERGSSAASSGRSCWSGSSCSGSWASAG